MARPKKANPIKDGFQARIDAVTKETANDLYVEINESTELTATAKQELNIALQVKMQANEQAEQDASAKPLDPVVVSVPSDEKSKAKKGSLPSWVKAVSATEEQVMKYQSNGKLFGHDPVKGIAYIIASLLMCLMLAAPAFADTEATLGDRESDGDYRWEVQAGNLVPGTTNTYTIGSASKYVNLLYASGIYTVNLSSSSQVSAPDIVGANLTATVAVTAPTVVASQYMQAQYFSNVTRPASGAPVGSIIVLGNDGTSCGVATAGTTLNVCVSNGTNWVKV